MKDEIISFETAKLARKKGFDEKCTTYYASLKKWQLESEHWKKYIVNKQGFVPYISNTPFPCIYGQEKKYHNSKLASNNISAPTQSLLSRWLREEHGILVYITPILNTKGYSEYKPTLYRLTNNFIISCCGIHKTYEKAMERGLQEALNLI